VADVQKLPINLLFSMCLIPGYGGLYRLRSAEVHAWAERMIDVLRKRSSGSRRRKGKRKSVQEPQGVLSCEKRGSKFTYGSSWKGRSQHQSGSWGSLVFSALVLYVPLYHQQSQSVCIF